MDYGSDQTELKQFFSMSNKTNKIVQDHFRVSKLSFYF
jgi:hypothetical protein